MQTKITVLEKENKALKTALSRVENEFQNKATIHDSRLRQISASIKDFEHINPFEVNTKLESLETNQRRIDSAVNRLKISNSKQGILKNTKEDVLHDFTTTPKCTAPATTIPARLSDPINRYSYNDNPSKTTPNSIKSTSVVASTYNTVTSGGTELNDKLQYSAVASGPRINNNVSSHQDKTVLPHLRQQGPTIGYKSDGTGCKTGENSGYVAADKLQSIGTSYCSSTQKTHNNNQDINVNVNNSRTNFDQVNEGITVRPIPEMVSAARQYLPFQTHSAPQTLNNMHSAIPGMYAYTYPTPPNINFGHGFSNLRMPGQINTGTQQLPNPLLAQYPYQQSTQTYNANSNNHQVTNDSSGGSTGSCHSNSTLSQNTQVENVAAPSVTPEKHSEQSETGDSGDVFVGTHRKRFISYFVSNIDQRSTRGGILTHFKNNGVIIHDLSLHRSRNNDCYAKVTVERRYKDAVESGDFDWPSGVRCTYWKTYNKRSRQSERRHNTNNK